MQLTLKNKDLTTLMTVLEKVEVRNIKANRGRAKLSAHAAIKLNEYLQDETDILKEYVEVTENGTFKRDDTGNLVLLESSKLKEVNDLLDELRAEEVVIKGGEYSKRYLDFLEFLSEYDGELALAEIELVDNLLEQYEVRKLEKEE
ncbi:MULTISPECIES: DUF1617 family protein [unclassified Streptococcus]|uniref:DUF1617 family protein n=1 Tax=unclassified Streptococcus TaxID=2608887 RepID=UPI00211B1D15|nr:MULTISPECIES: DUF1617 family protein [unclassified Streptococcus]MCQ9211811.1 DUF1617 family protein [Streptococcus sp. B01]MCQ9212842.1 DUF1617 family protein [Streptococcus sp. B01]MCQ9212931.1 DUF1617 family protein [Streptococcus sp. O1]MCQ9215007.1 DUF1617 family protein [Streptococcus sp. O1]